VLIPEKFAISGPNNADSSAMVTVRYRLIHPTVQSLDAFSLPRGAAIAKRLDAARGWALASLPAGNPARESIIAAAAEARKPIPAKRIVTAAGTEIESVAILKLQKQSDSWKVTIESLDVSPPGAPDRDADIPFEDSPEIAKKFDELEAAAGRIEESQRKYLADRQRAAERSLALLRSRLKTGNIFEGRLPDGAPVRLVISRGAETGDPIFAVLAVQRAEQSTARYAGGIVQQPSGESVWRAAQMSPLSGTDPLVTAEFHPILTLQSSESGLVAQAKSDFGSPAAFILHQSAAADLIPDIPPQEPLHK